MTGYYQLTTSTLKCILEEKGAPVSLVATLIKRKDNCHQKVVSWLHKFHYVGTQSWIFFCILHVTVVFGEVVQVQHCQHR